MSRTANSRSFLNQASLALEEPLPSPNVLLGDLQALNGKKDLGVSGCVKLMRWIMSGEAPEESIEAFLVGLADKGESPEEIAACAYTMRALAQNIEPRSRKYPLLDVVGTGGDGLNSFNVSTGAMFVAAAAGVPVAKHGNRGISSKCGSADVLEALGVAIDLNPPMVEECINHIGLGFMFAPKFHSAMRFVQPVRKRLARRTVFNILGPLTNPAKAQVLVLGVYDPKLAPVLSEVLAMMGVHRALVVCGEFEGRPMDELSTTAIVRVWQVEPEGNVEEWSLDPRALGLRPISGHELNGGDAAEGAKILRTVLSGEDSGPRRDLVCLNAAAGLYVSGRAADFEEALSIAIDQVRKGSALETAETLVRTSQELAQS